MNSCKCWVLKAIKKIIRHGNMEARTQQDQLGEVCMEERNWQSPCLQKVKGLIRNYTVNNSDTLQRSLEGWTEAISQEILVYWVMDTTEWAVRSNLDERHQIVYLTECTICGFKRCLGDLRAIAAFAEGLGSVPSTQMVANNHSYSQFQGKWCPFLTSNRHQACTQCTDMRASRALIHIIKSKTSVNFRHLLFEETDNVSLFISRYKIPYRVILSPGKLLTKSDSVLKSLCLNSSRWSECDSVKKLFNFFLRTKKLMQWGHWVRFFS